MLWALQSCSPHCDTLYWCFGFAIKAFLSAIFLIINVRSWNKSNLDTHNNLHSCCYGHYNHVLPFGMHDIGALYLQEKLFFLAIFLIIDTHLWNESNKDTHNNLHSFHSGITVMFSPLGCTILMLWICKKAFSLHHFPYI